jgi:hypothetical protein
MNCVMLATKGIGSRRSTDLHAACQAMEVLGSSTRLGWHRVVQYSMANPTRTVLVDRECAMWSGSNGGGGQSRIKPSAGTLGVRLWSSLKPLTEV